MTVKEILIKEKWTPVSKVTEIELETSILLNQIIDRVIEKYGDYQVVEPFED